MGLKVFFFFLIERCRYCVEMIMLRMNCVFGLEIEFDRYSL